MGDSLHRRPRWAALSPVFGVELAGMFKDPIISVGMIGRLIGGAVNLVGPV